MAYLRVIVLALAVAGALALHCHDNTPDKELDCPSLIGGLGSQLCHESWFLDGDYCMRSCGRAPCPAKKLDLQQGSVTLVGKRTGEQKDTSAPAAASVVLPPTVAAPVVTAEPTTYEKPEESAEQEVAAVTTVEVVEEAEESSGTVEQPEESGEQEVAAVTTVEVVEEAEESSVTVEQPEESVEQEEAATTVEVVEEVQESDGGCQDAASVIASRGELSFLKDAIERAGLGGSLSGFSGTIFAPSNAAFDQLLGLLGLSSESFFSGNMEVIQQLLKLHVIPGEQVTQDTSDKEVTSLLGGSQKIKVGGGSVTSPSGVASQIVETIDACNAVVVVVDGVIVPRPVEGVTSG